MRISYIDELVVKLEQLRVTANSFHDVAGWLEFHSLLLAKATSEVHRNRLPEAHTVMRQMQVNVLGEGVRTGPCYPNNGARRLAGEIERAENGCGPYPGQEIHIEGVCSEGIDLAAVFARTGYIQVVDKTAVIRPGSDTHSEHQTWLITLFAEDWPFVAAPCLRDYCEDSVEDLPSPALRILRCVFPGVTKETFMAYHRGGLLPEDAPSFRSWMFQFLQVARESSCALELPAGLAF
jgi:hypothetical protein